MNPFDLTPASIPFVHASDKAAMLQSVIPLAVAKGVASNADTLSATDIAIAAREPLRNANPNPDASYILTLTRYYKLMRPIAEHANDHDVLRATVANPSKWVSENVSLECSSIAGEAVAAAINLAAAKIFSGIGNHYDATRFFSEAEAILQEAATLAESGHLCGFLGPTHLRALALFAQAQSLESTAVSKINKLGAEEIESTELQTALRTLTEASALYDRVFKDLAPTASSSTVVASTSLFKAKLLPALARYVVANAYFNGNRLSNTATECRRASELLTVAQAALELTPDQERMTSELATAIIGIQSNLPVAGVDDEAQLYDLQRMTEQDFREFKQAYGAPTDVLPPWRNDSSQDTAALNELRRIVASKDDEIQALNISLRNAQLELLQVSSGSVLNTEVTYLKGLLEKEHETVKSLQEAAELKNKEVDALNEALKQQEEMVKSLCESISPSASRKNLKSPAAGDASTREADRRERMIKKLQMQVMSKDIEINELKSSLELANSGMLASTTGATTDEVDALRRDIAALQNAIDDKDKEVKWLEDEIRQKDDTMIELRGRTESEIESLQETAASKDQEIAKLEAELKSTLQMIQALKNSEADGAGATNILQREKAHLEDKLQEKENIVAELNEALRKKDLTIAELHESAAAQQRKEQETIDFYENLKREQNQVISDLRSSLSAKQATLAMAEETAKTLESEVQSLKSEVDAKTMEIESLLAMSTSKANDMDQTMEELQSLRTELLAKEGEIQTLRNLIEEKEAIITDLRMTESEHQNKYTTLQTTLQRLNEDLQSRDRQIVALLEEAEAAAERQKASQHLQEQLQRQISQQDIVSKSVQEQVCMMSDAACRARYLEDKLATKTYDEEVLRTMIQRVEDADRDKGRTIESLRTEIEFLRSEPKYQPDDRSGQIEALEDKIVALNTHIRYLTNELLQKEQELVHLANDDKSAETDRLKKLLISQDDELNELKENLFLLREKGISDGILDGEPTMVPASMLVSKQEEIDRLKEALESLSAEEPIIVTRHEEPEEDISSLKKQLTELTGLVASQAVQIEGLNAQLADKTRDLDTALYDVAVLRRALRVIEDDYRDSERSLDQLEQQAVNMKDAYELSLAAQVSPIGVLENELRALSTHNQQLIDVIDEKDGEISRLHASVIDAISASQVVVAPPDFSNLLTDKDAELERLRTLLDHPPVEQPVDDSQKYRDAIGFLKEELAYKDHEIRRMRADSAPSEVAQIVDASLKQALAQKEEEVARLKSALEDLASDHIGQKTGEPDTAALKALQQEISTKDDEIQKLTAVIAAMPRTHEPQDITDAAELVRILESNLEREKDDTAALRDALRNAEEKNNEQLREIDDLRRELDALRRAAPVEPLAAAAPADDDLLRSLRADNEMLMEDVHDKRQDIKVLERKLLQAKDVIEDLKDALVRVEPAELTAIADGDAEDIGRLQDLLENMKQREKELNRFYTDLLKQTQPAQAPEPLTQADFERILSEKDAELERLRTLLDHPPVEQPVDDSQKYRDAIGFLKEELAYKDHEIRRMRADSAPSEVAQIVDASLKQALAQKEEEVARLKSALEDLASDHIGQKTGEPDTAALKALQQEISTKDDEIQKLTAVIAAMPRTHEPQDITDAAELVRILESNLEREKDDTAALRDALRNAEEKNNEQLREIDDLRRELDALRRAAPVEPLAAAAPADDDLLRSLRADNEMLMEDVHDKRQDIKVLERKLLQAKDVIEDLKDALVRVEPAELTAIADGDAEDIGRLQDLLENMKQREKELNRFYTDLLKQTQPAQAPEPLTQADFERILSEKDAELERLRILTSDNATFFRKKLAAKDAEIRRLMSAASQPDEASHGTEYDVAVLQSALTVADDIINDKTRETEELQKLLDDLQEKLRDVDENKLYETIDMLRNDVDRLERCLNERTKELNSFKSAMPHDNVLANAVQREKEIERFYRNLIDSKDVMINQLKALLSADTDDLLRALRMDNQTLAEDVRDKANSLQDTTRKLRDAMNTIDRLQSELAHARTDELDDSRPSEQDSQSDGLQELQRIIQAKDEVISDLRQQLDTATDTTVDTAERIRVLESSLAEGSAREREAPAIISDDVTSLTQKIALLQDEIDEKQNTIEALVGAIKDFNEANASLRQSKIEMEDQVRYMRQALENTQGAMNHMLTSAIGQNSEVAAVLSPQLSAIDATTNMSALDMQQKIKYLTDELNKSRQEVDDMKKAFQESGSVGGSSYEIATLRKEINRLNKELDRYRSGSVVTPSFSRIQ
eukprot:XP_001705883.1 Coiled-coil protein [Giardia lamblia ATCC 50803]